MDGYLSGQTDGDIDGSADYLKNWRQEITFCFAMLSPLRNYTVVYMFYKKNKWRIGYGRKKY